MVGQADAPRDLDRVVKAIVRELDGDGAEAVVLAGSHARDEATQFSDVDLYAIGDGPRYRLRVEQGVLLSLSWRSAAQEREALRDPASVGGTVPGWRSARILHDPTSVAAALQADARAFDWSTIATECDAWVADQITGYAEEVLKLVGARRAGDGQVAAVQRSILALRLPMIMAVHQRVLYDAENRLWRLVAEAAGDRWATAQAEALGLGDPHRADEAALRLYQLAADAVRALLSVDQLAVVDFALAITRAEASDG
jgi:Nucleotidyltransferase domain